MTPVLRIRNSWFQALGDTTVFHLGGIFVVLDMGGTCDSRLSGKMTLKLQVSAATEGSRSWWHL